MSSPLVTAPAAGSAPEKRKRGRPSKKSLLEEDASVASTPSDAEERHKWTPDEDVKLIMERSAGRSFKLIGKDLGLQAKKVRAHYNALMIKQKKAQDETVKPAVEEPESLAKKARTDEKSKEPAAASASSSRKEPCECHGCTLRLNCSRCQVYYEHCQCTKEKPAAVSSFEAARVAAQKDLEEQQLRLGKLEQVRVCWGCGDAGAPCKCPECKAPREPCDCGTECKKCEIPFIHCECPRKPPVDAARLTPGGWAEYFNFCAEQKSKQRR